VVGCVVVIFVPICFGAGSESAVAMGLAGLAALIAAIVLLQWLFWRRREAAAGGERLT
jgi:flagellar biogenesis protein FliO